MTGDEFFTGSKRTNSSSDEKVKARILPVASTRMREKKKNTKGSEWVPAMRPYDVLLGRGKFIMTERLYRTSR